MGKKAFTLTELLVVIVVIGVFATILYPRYESFKIRAQLKEIPINIDILKAAERTRYFKTGTYYTFDQRDAGFVPADLADNLNVILEYDPDALVQYEASSPDDITLVITAHVKIGGAYNWLCRYRYDVSTQEETTEISSTHPYSVYVTWMWGEPHSG